MFSFFAKNMNFITRMGRLCNTKVKAYKRAPWQKEKKHGVNPN